MDEYAQPICVSTLAISGPSTNTTMVPSFSSRNTTPFNQRAETISSSNGLEDVKILVP